MTRERYYDLAGRLPLFFVMENQRWRLALADGIGKAGVQYSTLDGTVTRAWMPWEALRLASDIDVRYHADAVFC